MSERLSESDLDRFEVKGRMGDFKMSGPSARALVAEVRERRAAEQRVRDVLREWDETEPEDGWGRMAEEITAALDA